MVPDRLVYTLQVVIVQKQHGLQYFMLSCPDMRIPCVEVLVQALADYQGGW